MINSDVTSQIIQWSVGVPSVGVIIAYGISMIRRRMSADSKTLKDDRSYANMLDSYKTERDETRTERDRIITKLAQIEAERNDAISKVGKLTAEVEFLSTQVLELKVLIEKLGTNLDQARLEIHKCAVENARLQSHSQYLEELLERKISKISDHKKTPKDEGS